MIFYVLLHVQTYVAFALGLVAAPYKQLVRECGRQGFDQKLRSFNLQLVWHCLLCDDGKRFSAFGVGRRKLRGGWGGARFQGYLRARNLRCPPAGFRILGSQFCKKLVLGGSEGGPGHADDANKIRVGDVNDARYEIRAIVVFICAFHAFNERGIAVTQDQNAVHSRCHGAANERDMCSSVCITQGQDVAMVVFIRVVMVRWMNGVWCARCSSFALSCCVEWTGHV